MVVAARVVISHITLVWTFGSSLDGLVNADVYFFPFSVGRLESRTIFAFSNVNISLVVTAISTGKLNVGVSIGSSVLVWSLLDFALKTDLFLVLRKRALGFTYADILSSVLGSGWRVFFNDFFFSEFFVNLCPAGVVSTTFGELDLALYVSSGCGSMFVAAPVRRWEYAEGNRNSCVKVQIGEFPVRRACSSRIPFKRKTRRRLLLLCEGRKRGREYEDSV